MYQNKFLNSGLSRLSGHNGELLINHIKNVLKEVKKLSREFSLSPNESKILEILAVFHDIGKCEEKWQIEYKKRKKVNRPHALFSAITFYNLFCPLIEKNVLKEKEFYTLLFAILTHHRILHRYLYHRYLQRTE